MIKRLLFFAVFALLAYLAQLAAKTPAAFVVQRFGENWPVKMTGVTGSVWQGRAEQMVVAKLTIEPVSWRVEPLALLGGGVAANIDLAGNDLSGRLNASTDLKQRIKIRDSRLLMPARQLDIEQLPVDLGGNLFIRIEQLAFDLEPRWPADPQASLPIVEAQVSWQGAAVTSPVPLELGEFLLQMGNQDQTIRASLTSASGPLDTQGNLEIRADGHYQWVIRLYPRGEANGEIRDLLSLLGRPDRSGAVTLRNEGDVKRWF